MTPIMERLKADAPVSAIRRRVMNHDEHIRHLLAVVKELRAELDACKRDLKTVTNRLERMDSE